MERSPEVAAVIRGWFEAVARSDSSWVDRHASSHAGTRLIGTDPNEVLAGDAVANFLRNEATALAGVATLEIPEPEAFAEGNVGWGFATPRVTFPGHDPVSPRWTAVLRREGSEWKLVQIHASVALANEAVGFGDHD